MSHAAVGGRSRWGSREVNTADDVWGKNKKQAEKFTFMKLSMKPNGFSSTRMELYLKK